MLLATILAVLYVDAKPVFVDCERDTLNIDTSLIEGKITSRTKAIIPVHIYGHACDMEPILELSEKLGLKVIEDAAEAHGGLYQDKPCGSMGDLSCFSFYANKIITTGEGGMVLTNCDKAAAVTRKFKDLWHSDTKRFIHEKIGYNYRFTNLQAALGLGQLDHFDAFVARKIEIANRYVNVLSDVAGVRTLATKEGVKNVYWMVVIMIDEAAYGMSKDALREALLLEGIDTRDLFYPPSEQPVLAGYGGGAADYPNACWAAQNGCYLPSGLALTDAEIDRVAMAVKKLSKAG